MSFTTNSNSIQGGSQIGASGAHSQLYLTKILTILKENYDNSPRKSPQKKIQRIPESKHHARKSEYSEYEEPQLENSER